MNTSFKAILARFYSANEIFRLAFMLGVIAALFYPDYESLQTVRYIMGVFFAIIFISHITRKYALFNYIDMKELVDSAVKEKNTAAAVIFSSICAVICVCIVVASHFFTH